MQPNPDPTYPAYGHGDGSSPLAQGPGVFDVPPTRQIDVVTDDGFTRRQRTSNRQELGFTPQAQTGYPGLDTGVAAAVDVIPIVGKNDFAGDPPATDVTSPDDQNTAVPTVRM